MKRETWLTLLADLFFVWVILRYALGGWEMAWFLLTRIGPPAWFAVTVVAALMLYRSDYRTDIPLFVAGYALGFWGEWWGTTRGVWMYWNGETPPDYLPPLWAIGLLSVCHLRLLIIRITANVQVLLRPGWARWIGGLKAASLVVLPMLAFLHSAPRLAAVDWSSRLDAHFLAGAIVAIGLLLYRFDIEETFGLYLCGMLLGGTYEWLGTWMRGWTYVTREVPPLWIVPLWGLACVAMVKLSRLPAYLPNAARKIMNPGR